MTKSSSAAADSSLPYAQVEEQFLADPLSLCWKMPGLWLIAKASGPSSQAVVAKMRRILGIKRVGHAGTLDPLASGLLLIMAGNASRLFDHMQTFRKTYVAAFRLGQRTDSQDVSGNPVENWRAECSPPLETAALEKVLPRFLGTIWQTPPMHSALKRNGVPLYKLARKGVVVEREPRQVCCYSLKLDAFDGVAGSLTMTVSSGFYVRTLIDDLGLALGCGAVMTRLCRTAIGPFTLAAAKTVEECAARENIPE